MTLEEINDIPDKGERLVLLKRYIEEQLEIRRRAEEHFARQAQSTDLSNETSLRDEAGGMMSRFGKSME
jgi:hypothetical protein